MSYFRSSSAGVLYFNGVSSLVFLPKLQLAPVFTLSSILLQTNAKIAFQAKFKFGMPCNFNMFSIFEMAKVTSADLSETLSQADFNGVENRKRMYELTLESVKNMERVGVNGLQGQDAVAGF